MHLSLYYFIGNSSASRTLSKYIGENGIVHGEKKGLDLLQEREENKS